ncbi:hypothetical protein HYH03_017228 [Edaphochlamys debaryana]|uniref:Bulb-type lectin domain-containing protein n=1 Tax=Edaphochlamys debaryana TaxID=47281 RepID=A0A835XIS2_9CHLO|nr:hypothetical protein HYH03_017228 [Edaphochlamys debaryana]|eukprot:KAG2483907.1 hypothetical protein HYH03_017228 [Edaphochlamys debaryana]
MASLHSFKGLQPCSAAWLAVLLVAAILATALAPASASRQLSAQQADLFKVGSLDTDFGAIHTAAVELPAAAEAAPGEAERATVKQLVAFLKTVKDVKGLQDALESDDASMPLGDTALDTARGSRADPRLGGIIPWCKIILTAGCGACTSTGGPALLLAGLLCAAIIGCIVAPVATSRQLEGRAGLLGAGTAEGGVPSAARPRLDLRGLDPEHALAELQALKARGPLKLGSGEWEPWVCELLLDSPPNPPARRPRRPYNGPVAPPRPPKQPRGTSAPPKAPKRTRGTRSAPLASPAAPPSPPSPVPPAPPPVLPGFTSMVSPSGTRGCPTRLATCNQNLQTCGIYRQPSTTIDWSCHRLYSPDLNMYLEIDEQQALFVRDSARSVHFTSYGYTRLGSVDYTDFGDEPTTVLLTPSGKWVQVSSANESLVFTSSDNFGTTFPELAGPDNGPFTLNVSNSGELMILNKDGARSWSSVDIHAGMCARTKRVKWRSGRTDGQKAWLVCTCARGGVNIKFWMDATDPGSVCFDFPDPLILLTETNPAGSRVSLAIGLPRRAPAAAGAALSQQRLDPRSNKQHLVFQEVGSEADDFWLDVDDYDTVSYYWLRLDSEEGLCVTAYAGTARPVDLQPCDSRVRGQQFLVEQLTSQQFALITRAEATQTQFVELPHCLEVAGGSPEGGATLTQSRCSYSVAQRFRYYVEPDGGSRRSALAAALPPLGPHEDDLLPWERPDLDLAALPDWKRELVEAYRAGAQP